jgi:hypothetical protein
MNRSAISFKFLLIPLVLVILPGCGSGPRRSEVTGTVVFQGLPLEEGIIEFEPLDRQGSKSGASILNGEYRIPRDKGLFPGRYRVTIIGGDGVSGAGQADPSSRKPDFIPGKKERIPPEYNLDSRVIREVTVGPNRFDFDIS